MAQGLMGKVQEQAGEWDVVRKEGWEGWEEVVLGQVQKGIAFVPFVGQRFPTKQVFLAMT